MERTLNRLHRGTTKALPMKRLLDPGALRALARGCAVLGAGGGGDTYIALLQALQATEDYGPVPLVDVDELPGDSLIMPCGGIGAPTVSIEKIENGDEGERLKQELEYLTGRRVAALMASEIGGGNGVLPVATIHGSVSLAIRIGEAVTGATGDPVAALIAEIAAFRLIVGKISDVERQTRSGFVRGSVVIEGLGADTGRLLRLELQNENLVALERGGVLASVPDLITVLDTETADAIATERIRYGQRVTVIAFPCDPVWRTERGIAVAGPRAFDYDFDYVPVEELAGTTT
jgi:DUF917 family protein